MTKQRTPLEQQKAEALAVDAINNPKFDINPPPIDAGEDDILDYFQYLAKLEDLKTLDIDAVRQHFFDREFEKKLELFDEHFIIPSFLWGTGENQKKTLMAGVAYTHYVEMTRAMLEVGTPTCKVIVPGDDSIEAVEVSIDAAFEGVEKMFRLGESDCGTGANNWPNT